MVFSSLSFIFLLFPLFLACDFVARRCSYITLRNAILVLVSLLFYLWGESTNVFLLLGLGFFNYFAGTFLARENKKIVKLSICVAINLLVLIGFKYSFWLISFVIPAYAEKKSVMPLGISFFTFHAISYLVDIYRNDIKPAKSVTDFLTYFCMFPHLVAGPIVRFTHVQHDLSKRGPSSELFSFGMYRFLLGLNKKILIANPISDLVDYAFLLSKADCLGFADAWIGIIGYTLQIYFDFSAYSDMAIGLAAMAGFHFEENFKRPYSAVSIRDFWRRWHISLSSWLRDYLYIPLGGSRCSAGRTYRNLILVFFLCGLWHGADITFILWGLWHGLFLVFERLPIGQWTNRLPHILARGYVFLIVAVGWVFFRADNVQEAWGYVGAMFDFSLSPILLTYFSSALIAMISGIVLCFVPDSFLPSPTVHAPKEFSSIAYLFQVMLAIVSIGMLLISTRNPFIYFNF